MRKNGRKRAVRCFYGHAFVRLSPFCFGVVSAFDGMDQPPSLAKAPHNNVISAVSIDDREGAIGMMMPILLPKAEVDFGTVIRHGGCSVAMKLRFASHA